LRRSSQDPLETSVITCGTIKGGYASNIIADHVEIVGTTRSFTKQAQQLIKARMGCICCGVAQTYGGEVQLDYEGQSGVHNIYYTALS
jgi:metal-dependent amidase/aminoacylase/carboxypeptidase family protein